MNSSPVEPGSMAADGKRKCHTLGANIWADKDNFTDVTLKVGDNSHGGECAEFLAHKAVLAARSPVFKAMLSGQFLEQDIIEITDVHPHIFADFLRFLYTEEVQFEDVGRACLCLYAAKKYRLECLREECVSQATKLLDAERPCLGAVHVLDCSALLCLDNLAEKALLDRAETALRRWYAEVLDSSELTEVGKETIRRVLSQNKICKEVGELRLFNAVNRWAESESARLHSSSSKKEVAAELLNEIRFGLFTDEEMEETVLPSGLLTQDQVNSFVQHPLSSVQRAFGHDKIDFSLSSVSRFVPARICPYFYLRFAVSTPLQLLSATFTAPVSKLQICHLQQRRIVAAARDINDVIFEFPEPLFIEAHSVYLLSMERDISMDTGAYLEQTEDESVHEQITVITAEDFEPDLVQDDVTISVQLQRINTLGSTFRETLLSGFAVHK